MIKMMFVDRGNNAYNKREQIQIQSQPREQLKEQINKSNESTIDNSRSRWGPSTWFLFHTLAQKIKEEEFMNIRNELLDLIKSICFNLPCPSCAQHATEYISKLNYNSIKNKEDLKMYFLQFHNVANKKSNKSIFTITELNEKYSNANTVNIIKNFIIVFQYKSKSFNMIANEMQRDRQIEQYKTWFNKNINSFDP
jgi:Erv1 / Alr family